MSSNLKTQDDKPQNISVSNLACTNIEELCCRQCLHFFRPPSLTDNEKWDQVKKGEVQNMKMQLLEMGFLEKEDWERQNPQKAHQKRDVDDDNEEKAEEKKLRWYVDNKILKSNNPIVIRKSFSMACSANGHQDLSGPCAVNEQFNTKIEQVLEHNSFHITTDLNREWTLYWSAKIILPSHTHLSAMKNWQRVNHFPESIQVVRKDLLIKTVRKMQAKYPNQFTFLPESFVLPEELEIAQKRIDQAAKEEPNVRWIRKPPGSSQGRGIELVNHEKPIKKDKEVVICRYVEHPLLINGFKFDMRLYVAITSMYPLRIYLYSEGLTRLATQKYQPAYTTKNRFIHLTNYSINKLSVQGFDQPVGDREGHKWGLEGMFAYLEENQLCDPHTLMQDIAALIVQTILSYRNASLEASAKMIPFANNCFEMMGFDVIVDSELKPWLLEVNHCPSLTCDAIFDHTVKGEMVCDLLNMVGIPLEKQCSEGLSILTKDKDSPNSSNPLLDIARSELNRVRGWKLIYPSTNSLFDRFADEALKPIDHLQKRMIQSEFPGLLRPYYEHYLSDNKFTQLHKRNSSERRRNSPNENH